MAQLNKNALDLLEKRYYLRNLETGEAIEHSPEEMFRRVAHYVASAEKTKELQEYWEEKFYNVMNDQLFIPNTPTLINAGKNKCLSACSVIGEYPDSLEGIYEYLWRAAKLTKYGCGVGQSLSSIRPKGEIIKSSGGTSAGVVNWMKSIQTMAETTIQGDQARRAANMVGLRFNHPDILDFIDSKLGNDNFNTMNISVIITNEEFEKALNKENIWLEWNSIKYKEINAGDILDRIIENAWKDGEPGIIFIDHINDNNPFNLNDGNFNKDNEHYIDITNPCGEQPLEKDEFCTLGSINVEKLYNLKTNSINYTLLNEVIEIAERFLDNIVDVNEFVFPEFEKKMKGNRKIGIGILGFAHLLIKLGIRYDSQQCLDCIDFFNSYIYEKSQEINIKLAKEKGCFPNWKDSIFAKNNILRRNATITTQAPTGSTTTIAGSVCYGIEPLFNIGYIRRIVNVEIFEINELFTAMLHEIVNDEAKEKQIIRDCVNKGTTNLPSVPKKLRELFRCANDISAEWHVKILGQLQKYYDNAVSKTINMPESATKDDVRNAYELAYKLGCKGITIYRNNSRALQTIQIGNKKENEILEFPRGTIEEVPKDLIYRKYKLKTGCGTLYFFVGVDDEGKIYDCFCNTDGVSGCVVNTQAVSRLISANLRSGTPIEYIITQLDKAGVCPSFQYKRGAGEKLSNGKSCASAIGNVLKGIIKEFDEAEKEEKLEVEVKHVVKNQQQDIKNICPSCGAELILIEGCKACQSCGYSKCN
jgi:ribonucleoside-diphosphate reductase alpha chain